MNWRDEQGHAIHERNGVVIDLTERRVLAVDEIAKLAKAQRKLAKRYPEPSIGPVDSAGIDFDIFESSTGLTA